jgi:TRAP-type C4-dicarboxylate transport system permease small subunit
VVAVAATVTLAYQVLPIAAWAFARMLTVTLNACLWVAALLGSGADGWTIVATIGRAAADTLSTPEASLVLIALVVAAALALFGLQRLLESEKDQDQ